MNQILVSIPISFILGIIVGFFIGQKRAFKDVILPDFEKKINDKLKVLHKAEPKTYQQKVAEALDKDKPVIKTFYK